MSSVALTGNDTIIVNGRVMSDLADQDIATLGFPNEVASLKTGKNGNSIYSLNETGKQADLVLRIVKGSNDDKFLNGIMASQEINFAGFILLSGEFVKKIGDGQGNITKDTYIMSGGIFVNQIDAKSNTEGDTEQSVSIYKMKFSNAPRILT